MTDHQHRLQFRTLPRLAGLFALALILSVSLSACGETDAESEPVNGEAAGNTNDAGEGSSAVSTDAFLGDFAVGPVDAPVTVIEYASLTCNHCASFHKSTFPRLKQNFIDKGRIRFVMREYPLDRFALEAAILSRCGGEEKYLDLVDTLFEEQADWAFSGGPDVIRRKLRAIGEENGISEAQYNACLEDKTLEARLIARMSEGQNRYDVAATPTLVIDGKKYEGSPAYTEVAKHLLSILPAQ